MTKGGKRSLSGMEMQESSTSRGRPRRRWSIRRNPLPINPVILASGGSETVNVIKVDYVARWADYDTEECIQKALEDGEIELYYLSRSGDRGYDTYRLTAKGRRASDRHIREVFRRSSEVARRECERKRRGSAQARPAAGAKTGARAAGAHTF